MKTFREFLEEAALTEMRKEDKVKGKEKTPLYVNPDIKVIQKSPEGKWKTEKIKRFPGKGTLNPVVSMARSRRATRYTHGSGTSGHTGHSSSGIIVDPSDPGAPQPHGTSDGKKGYLRGVKKVPGDPTKKQDPGPLPKGEFFHQTPAQKVQRRRERGGSYNYKKNGRLS